MLVNFKNQSYQNETLLICCQCPQRSLRPCFRWVYTALRPCRKTRVCVWLPVRKNDCLHPLLFGLFQLLNMMTEFECRSELESHVLHDDITAQQHQSFAINLL